MVAELVMFVVGSAIALGIGYAGFLGGRDSAERQSYATVSTLRAELARERLTSDRLREHNRMLSDRLDRAHLPRTGVPTWMQ